jgi:hypothetical protein
MEVVVMVVVVAQLLWWWRNVSGHSIDGGSGSVW